MKNPAANRTIASILRALGIDPVQYGLLLDLFGKLSDRQEFELGSGQLSIRIGVGVAAVLSAFGNLIVAFVIKPPLRSFIFGNFVFTTFLLVMILTMEAINTFLNPVEAVALAHQPIRNSSYLAAKLTHLEMVVAYVVFPVSVVPSLVGLNLEGSSWFYPITYLISAFLLGSFIALVACGALGMLFRVLPASRVRNVVLWIQIVVFILIQSGGRILRGLGGVSKRTNIAESTALPLNWFVALASPAGRVLRTFGTWQAAVSLVACAAFIALGIRSLSEGYLTRVHILLRSGSSRRRTRSGWLGSALRIVTGKPAGRGAMSFFYAMARTDWQFRRTVYPLLFQLLVLPMIGLARVGVGGSPFQPGPPSAAQLAPHLTGLIGFLLCFALTSSNQHRAAWIFLTFPLDAIRTFVRGIYWSLWILVNALPVMLTPFLAYRWGVADAALFTIYSLAIGSFYLSVEFFAINGLPFGNPPESMRASMTGPLMIAAFIGALILVGIQWFFLFRSRLVTVGSVLAFAGAAFVIANTSMHYVEINVLHNLHRIATGETGMFKEVF